MLPTNGNMHGHGHGHSQYGGVGASGAATGTGSAGTALLSPALSFMDRATQTNFETVFMNALQSGGAVPGSGVVTPGTPISGDAVKAILLRSALPQEFLAQIWTLSHLQPPNVPGLSLPEFLLAMFLCKHSVDTKQPPMAALPEHVAQEVLSAIQTLALSASVASLPRRSAAAASAPTPPPPGHSWSPSPGPSSSPAPAPRPSSATPTPSISSSFSIPLVQQAQFDSVFSAWDERKTGFIDGTVARDIFRQSGLSVGVLSQIWEMVDLEKRGKLNKKEFAVAMFLVNRSVQGLELPSSIPKELFSFIKGYSLSTSSSPAKPVVSTAPAPEFKSMTERLNALKVSSPEIKENFDFLGPGTVDSRRAGSPSSNGPTRGQETDFEARFPDLDEIIGGKPKGVSSSSPSRPEPLAKSAQPNLLPTSPSRPSLVSSTTPSAPSTKPPSKERIELDSLYPSILDLEKRKAEVTAQISAERHLLDSLRKEATSRKESLERGLKALDSLLETKRNELSQLENKSSNLPEEDVQARAQRMLAERMAKMGITGIAPPTPSPPPSSSPAPSEDKAKRNELQAKIRELERTRLGVVDVLEELGGIRARRVVESARLESQRVGKPSVSGVEVREFLDKKEWDLGRVRVQGKEEGERKGKRRETQEASPLLPSAGSPLPGRSPTTIGLSASNASTVAPTKDLDRTADYTVKALAQVQAALQDAQQRQEQAMKKAGEALQEVKSARWGPARDAPAPPPPPVKKPPPPMPKPKPSLLLEVARKGPPPPPPPKKIKAPEPPAPITVEDFLPRAPTPERPALEAMPDSPPTPAEERFAEELGEMEPLPPSAFPEVVQALPPPPEEIVKEEARPQQKEVQVEEKDVKPESPKPSKEEELPKEAEPFSPAFNPFLSAPPSAVPQSAVTDTDFWAEVDAAAGPPVSASTNPFDRPVTASATKTPFDEIEPKKEEEEDSFAALAKGRQEEIEVKEVPKRTASPADHKEELPSKEPSSSSLLTPATLTIPRRVSDDWLMEPTSEQIKPSTPPSPPIPLSTLSSSTPPPPPPPPPPAGTTSAPVAKPAAVEKAPEPAKPVEPERAQSEKDESPIGSIAERRKMLATILGGGGAAAVAAKAKEAVAAVDEAAAAPKAKKWPTVDVTAEAVVPEAPVTSPFSSGITPPPVTTPQKEVLTPAKESAEDIFADASEQQQSSVGAAALFAPMPPSASTTTTVPEPPTKAEIGNVIRYVYALYPFPKTQPDDLSFSEGAKIGVEREEPEWLYGRVVEGEGEKDDAGWFPASYVSDSLPVPASAVEGSSESLPSPTPSAVSIPDKPVAVAEVIYDYDAVRDDELTIREGWIVNIMAKADEGWWVAEKDGNRGVVPSTYVQEITEAEAQAKRSGANKRHSKAGSIDDTRRYSHRSTDSTGGVGMPRMTLSRSQTEFNLPGGERRTWASQVDAEFLAQTTPEERKRQEAIFELIATEQHYVRDLQLILEVFYQPLQKFPSVSQQDLVGIFNNIEEILMCNSLIVSDFEQLQSDQGGVIHAVGMTFLNHVKALQAYQQYCGKQMQSSKFLQKKRSEDKALGEFLKRTQLHPKCRSLDLSSFLLEPMQRITRYPLLFRQVLHYTPVDHPDHIAILQSLEACEGLLGKVNDMVRDIDNQAKLEEISQLVDLDSADENINLFTPTKYVGPRLFIYEGVIAKAKSGRKLYGFLFNDLLLITQARSQAAKSIGRSSYQYSLYRKALPLSECAAREIPPSAKPPFAVDDTCFQVIHVQEVITLRASSVSAKRNWLNHLDNACSAISMAIRRQERAKHSGGVNAMGTLQITVHEARDLTQPENTSRSDVFVAAQVERQVSKTRSVRDSLSPKWSQSLLFTIHTLDEPVRLTVYNFDKYSSDEFLGTCQLGLDTLERYAGRETDRIQLPLRGVPSGSLVITMQFRRS